MDDSGRSVFDAVDALVKATFPRPGDWRWEANPKSHSISLGTRGNEAMTFARWGMQGAQPVFMTRADGLSILRDASEFLRPITGREHHRRWAAQIDHPVARAVELGVNLLEPLMAVARASAGLRDAVNSPYAPLDVHHGLHIVRLERELDAALVLFKTAAAGQGLVS